MGLFSVLIEGGILWLRYLVTIGLLFGVLGLMAWGAVALFRGGETGGPVPATPDPEQILKVRLARGEIDTEEYERLRGYIRT